MKTKDVDPSGESLGTWTAGVNASVGTCVAVVGSEPANRLCFYHSHAPGGKPRIYLRVHGPDGKMREEIPFCGGGP